MDIEDLLPACDTEDCWCENNINRGSLKYGSVDLISNGNYVPSVVDHSISESDGPPFYFNLCEVCYDNSEGIHKKCSLCGTTMYDEWIIIPDRACRGCIDEDDIESHIGPGLLERCKKRCEDLGEELCLIEYLDEFYKGTPLFDRINTVIRNVYNVEKRKAEERKSRKRAREENILETNKRALKKWIPLMPEEHVNRLSALIKSPMSEEDSASFFNSLFKS